MSNATLVLLRKIAGEIGRQGGIVRFPSFRHIRQGLNGSASLWHDS
jgi:hypothetical protein